MSEKTVLEGKLWSFHPPIEVDKKTLNEVYAHWLREHGIITPEQADSIRYAMSYAIFDSRDKHRKPDIMPNYTQLRNDLRVASQHAERLSATQKNRYFYNQLSKLLRDSASLITVVEDGADLSHYNFETENPLIQLVKATLETKKRDP